MSNAKKFRDNYPKESSNDDTQLQKKQIEVYIQKISEILKETDGQKKAAEILSQLINSK